MPSSFPYLIEAAFDKMIPAFEDQLTYAALANKIDLGSPQEQVYSRDRIQIPQPMIATSYDGFDQTSNFGGLTQLWVPASIGYHKSTPKALSSKDYRNKAAVNMYTSAVMRRLASDVNTQVRNRVALEGSVFNRRTVAPTGSADLFIANAQFSEIGVPVTDRRVAMIGIRAATGMLSNVSDRGTMGELSMSAYERAKLAENIATFEVFQDDQPVRLQPAAGGTTTVNGANQYWEPAATTVAADGTENNRDNRYSTLVVTAANIALIKKGDAFTLPGVNAIHLESKNDTGQLKTFRVIAVNTTTNTLTVAPAIISNGGNTVAGRELQNVSATPANGAQLTWLNTTLAEINPFFLPEAVGLLPGTFEVDPEDGWDVMQATTPKYGLRIVCTKQGSINDLSMKVRWDIDFGTVLTETQYAGAMMFNQA